MPNITTLAELEAQKQQLRSDIERQTNIIAETWDDMFVQKEPNTRAERFTQLASNAIGIADGLYFGWKMYRRFGSVLHFGRKKHK